MSKVELSRRGFLKSTLAATGAAMAGTAAHAGDIPEKWQQPHWQPLRKVLKSC